METALENLSKEDLLKVISSKAQQMSLLSGERESLFRESSAKDEEIGYLESQLAMYRRMQSGQKRERFEGDPNQTTLPFEAEPMAVEQQQEVIREKIEYTRKRPDHRGRAKLPGHLPVQEIEIHPAGGPIGYGMHRKGDHRGTRMRTCKVLYQTLYPL